MRPWGLSSCRNSRVARSEKGNYQGPFNNLLRHCGCEAQDRRNVRDGEGSMVPFLQVSISDLLSQSIKSLKRVEPMLNLWDWMKSGRPSMLVVIRAVACTYGNIIRYTSNDVRMETYLRTIMRCLDRCGENSRKQRRIRRPCNKESWMGCSKLLRLLLSSLERVFYRQ
jgi:hypothetical protein